MFPFFVTDHLIVSRVQTSGLSTINTCDRSRITGKRSYVADKKFLGAPYFWAINSPHMLARNSQLPASEARDPILQVIITHFNKNYKFRLKSITFQQVHQNYN